MYQLVIVRHAIAMDVDEAREAGISEEQRPLTDKGRDKMDKAARGLTGLFDRCAVIFASPLLRAQQTADIVAEHFNNVPVVSCPALAPGVEPDRLLAWLQQRSAQTPTIIVGHEPGLGQWASWALTGQPGDYMPFKKGGAGLLEFPDRLQAGQAQLRWLCTPKQLSAVGQD